MTMNIDIDIEHDRFYDDHDHQGWVYRLIVDPDSESVFVFCNVGAGTPESVWNDRAKSFLMPDCRGKELAEWLEEHKEMIEGIVACYKGSEWNGNDHIGHWSDDAEDVIGTFWAELEQLELPRRWSATDWLHGSRSELLDALNEGQTLTDWVDTVIDEADEALLDRDDVKEWAEYELKEWVDAIDWHTPPANQGQTVSVSYGIDDNQTCWKKSFDASDRSTSLTCMGHIDDYDDDAWEPWNSAPAHNNA